MKTGKKHSNQKGFTLIELLAVIIILGIIIGIAVPSIGGIIQSSKEDAVKADALLTLIAASLYTTSNESDSTSISSDELSPYIESVNLGDFNVMVDSKKYALVTSTIPVGKFSITFACATKEDISKDNKKGSRVIGSCEGTVTPPGKDLDNGSNPDDGTNPDTGSDPDDGSNSDTGSDPDDGSNPDTGSDPNDGSDPDSGTIPPHVPNPEPGDNWWDFWLRLWKWLDWREFWERWEDFWD
ncbi:type II secretion system protein [Ornithinibacillus scapharcae]|uniref:type II secretion system protein n=1 Tax=Ornithinibacillus scapharcae TaxID=1147159 RepID=UPI000225B0D0|nr:prepilin-type N-terminal cleavage/methylation domain-containing protein [Ornithinibacillus scapharcae]